MGGTGRPLGKTFFLQCQRRHPELPKIPTYLYHLLWVYFVTVSEFSYLARPYPVSGLTPMPQIPNQLHFIQKSAHKVLSAILEA